MAWTVEWRDTAVKALSKLNHEAQWRIFRYLQSRIAVDDDPRRFGKALTGDNAGLWRYRVGDYRIVCQIEDNRLTVLVVAIGHRKLVYQ